jgi:hypothetical protein
MASSHSASSSRHASTGLDVHSASTKDELIAALDINPELCGDENTDKGLINAYAKWKAITEAYQKMRGMEWTGTKPTYGRIINLFVSTSMFYSHYKHFNKAVKYPEMVEWLEDGPNSPSNVDIWGREKPHYTFSDLIQWFQVKAEDGQDSSDGRQKKRKKVSRKKDKSSSPQPSLKDGKRIHKAKSKSSGVLKKGSGKK